MSPYYSTIQEDLDRAKQILEDGAFKKEELPEYVPESIKDLMVHHAGGTIYGKDIFAARKLLESFVYEVEILLRLVKEVRDHLPPHLQAKCYLATGESV